MADILPLAVYPWPVPPETLDLIRRAKAELDLDYKVLPVRAVIGGPGRVLTLGPSVPPWLCDTAPVRDPARYESILAALRWILTAPDGDTRAYMVMDYMNAIFGEGVREVFDDEP